MIKSFNEINFLVIRSISDSNVYDALLYHNPKNASKIRYKNNFVFINFIDFYIFFHKIYLLDQYAFIYNYQNELMAMPEMNSLF